MMPMLETPIVTRKTKDLYTVRSRAILDFNQSTPCVEVEIVYHDLGWSRAHNVATESGTVRFRRLSQDGFDPYSDWHCSLETKIAIEESEEDFRAGRYRRFNTIEELLASLDG